MIPPNTKFNLFGGHWFQANSKKPSLLTAKTARRLVRGGFAKWTARDAFKRSRPPITMQVIKPLRAAQLQPA
jgi:hypothetical protein